MQKFEHANITVFEEEKNNSFAFVLEQPEVSKTEVNEAYGKYTFGPLERGFATTLGNALRRVLLSSLPGAAVCAIRINSHNIYHEFSAIEGVVEDVTEIILNLKKLIIKINDIETLTDEVFQLKITKDEAGNVLGSDIELPSDIEIINKDLHICSIEDGGKLDIDLFVKIGRGYENSVTNKKLYHGSDVFVDEKIIYIDSIYTPVVNVAYLVKSTRVGQSAKYENVILEVQTNGALSAGKSISIASMILIAHFKLLSKIEDVKLVSDTLISEEEEVVESNEETVAIEDLGLKVRAYNCLKRAGISTLAELLQKTEKEIMEIHNLGKTSFEELKEKISERGYSFRQKD